MARQNTIQFEEQNSQFSRGANPDEVFQLKQTLDAYEVEEIDGHDLSRFLSGMDLVQKTGIN